ncbi:hypothetical protein K445DRAFT_57310 [Daldinia sp. EC12]|nr:hypothetical protein K445DRAFT_57310 [Daldinia sp. EC12]
MSYVSWLAATVTALNRIHLLLATLFTLSIVLLLFALKPPKYVLSEQFPLINKRFAWEPRLFARLRWAVFCREILQAAYNNAGGKPYQLERGDADYVILPASTIPELNRLPPDILNTRKHHSFSLLGHLTGMDVILKTSYHVKTLLGRISPAINDATPLMAERMTARLSHLFPQEIGVWASIDPVDALVNCIIFTLAFCMRIVPSFLQPILVWLLPAKWRLLRGWRTWDRIVIPEVRRRLQEKDFDPSKRGDLISWMLHDAKTPIERDEHVLCHLCAAVIAGATYSTANIASEALVELVANPDILDEVRSEIKQKHADIGGRWDLAALDSLYKLESALKETSRLSPGAALVYQRVVQRDVQLSCGVRLKRGQFIAVTSQEGIMAYTANKDVPGHIPNTYDGMRFYNEDLERHKATPFSGINGPLLTWGSGRWACPGRIVANMMIKVLMVELLDKYEFEFVKGKKPGVIRIHEFLMLNPMAKIRVRRREKPLCGIVIAPTR